MDSGREQEMRERAEAMGRAALGLTVTVKLRPEARMAAVRSISGPLVEAHFGRFDRTPRGFRVVWKCVIEAGVSRTRHVVWLAKLPA
jgi:hypothetical protein